MVFTSGKQDEYNYIFPMPQKQRFESGFYILKEEYGAEDIYEFYCKNKNGSRDIIPEKNVMLGEEEYTIDVDKNGIRLGFSCEKGLFRAMSSLRQLMTGSKIRFCSVQDKPQFKHRGVMLDISRSRVPKPEKICEIIDFLAGLKYNEFQLYMENFCFKYSEFPQFTEDFDCLTAEDIEMLDKYCSDRFIELVPNQNGFGHMSAWLATDEFKHLEVSGGSCHTGTLNILEPESFELIDKIYSSLLPHFSSNRVHIGLDEAMGLGKYQLEEICREQGEENVFVDWLNKLSGLCEQKYGKSVIFWGDMIINYPESFKKIPKTSVPVEWDYEPMSSQFISLRCRQMHELGLKYFVAPASLTWMSLCGRFEAACDNIRTMAEMGQEYGAEGFLLTVWGDGGHTQFGVWELVPAALAAQYSWNVGIKQHGGWRKPYFIYGAQDYVDRYVLGDRAARELCKLANYYLLEPERIHGGTICSWILRTPLKEMVREDFYDFSEIGEKFCFENVYAYVEKILADVRNINFKEIYKREAILNAKMVQLACEYAIVKIDGCVPEQKARDIIAFSESICSEYDKLWHASCFDRGIEVSLGQLKARQKELDEFIK